MGGRWGRHAHHTTTTVRFQVLGADHAVGVTLRVSFGVQVGPLG
jgi:hypothetical protein